MKGGEMGIGKCGCVWGNTGHRETPCKDHEVLAVLEEIRNAIQKIASVVEAQHKDNKM